MASPLTAFQKAVYTALTDDSALNAAVTGIFNRVPQDQPPPYVALELAHATDRSTLAARGLEVELLLHVITDDHNGTETQAIEDHIYRLLHHASLTLEDSNSLQHLYFEDSKTSLSRDGITTQTTMRFIGHLTIAP